MATAKVLRYVAFTMMALFGLLGTLFVAGYAFEDPGGWAAVGITALWVVPMAGLSVYALLRPESAAPVLVGVTAVALLFAVADAVFGIIPRDDWGPVTAISVFAVGVALAFLGLHRATLAGTLMVVAAAVQLLAMIVGSAIHQAGEGPRLGAMLGGSSGVVVLPMLLVGALFLLAGSLAHEPLRPGHTPDEQRPLTPTR